MNLLGMEIFARVVQAGSFAGAARRLRLSQSVVSKHVTGIERTLGVRLLNRTTRSISLTEVGALFYERCATILDSAEEAEESARSLHSQPRGTLRISVPAAFGVLHIAPALPQLLDACPELRVEMTLGDRMVNLAAEGHDAAVLICREPPPLLVARKLAPVLRRVCAAPEYLGRHGVPECPQDLARHNCIVCAPSDSEREWCFNAPEGPVRVEVRGNAVVNNENAIRQMALAGQGVALLPSYLIGEDLQKGRLRALLPDYSAPATWVHAVYLSNRQVATKVRLFVDFLLARFGDPPYWDLPD